MHHWQAEQAVALLDVGRGDRVLDVATGTGLAMRAAGPGSRPTASFAGVDVSAQVLQVARRHSRTPRVGYLRADAHHLPLADRSFDAILCISALPYLRDVPEAIAEWRRVARPGGVVIFTTPAAGGLTVTQPAPCGCCPARRQPRRPARGAR